ncbi:MAG: hypothetical protein Q8L48_35450 [Archangium sp.]|nr:hypothetical protein [Archangium sp.]
MFRFYAVPAWQLLDPSASLGTGPTAKAMPPEEPLVPTSDPAFLEAALARVEYRGFKARERALDLLSAKSPAVFASSPNDLPALLRTADQLLTIAKMDAGERAQVWRCHCGTPYAVPVGLVRPVSLSCERCGEVVELDPNQSLGETFAADARTATVNAARLALSEFFREAMARGWPVLVARS